jgi:hypothetical protein
MVRMGEDIPAGGRLVARFRVVTRGATLTFAVPRRALGDPARFEFTVAAAREHADAADSGGAADFAPARGSFGYTLAR